MSNQSIETERKFLVCPFLDLNRLSETDPNLTLIAAKEINQYYLMSNDISSVRVRKIVNHKEETISYTMTIKENLDEDFAFSVSEREFSISKQTFEEISGQAISAILKTRYEILDTSSGSIWELDSFSKSNLGSFLMAEIELKSEDQKFNLPSFIQDEVTQLPEYKNQNLAIKL